MQVALISKVDIVTQVQPGVDLVHFKQVVGYLSLRPLRLAHIAVLFMSM